MKKAAIIDLDGTLIAGNSFTMYVKRIFLTRPKVLPWVILRKLRLISHAKAKQEIMRIGASEAAMTRFVTELAGMARPEVIALAADCEIRVLATAAPEAYALPLGRMLGFTHVLATSIGGRENKGAEKCRRVAELLAKLRAEAAKVATDHEDDMPLIEAFPKAERHFFGRLARKA